MQLVDLTLPTPAENLALDEALLDEAESGAEPREVLRLWEPCEPFVVLGRSSHAAGEVNLPYCNAHGISILRRASGGAAIVAGPGSLMYAVVLSYDLRPALRSLDEAHRFVLATNLNGLRLLALDAEHRGTSDLAIGSRKVSGNSVRCKRRHFLYHGTVLYNFDTELIERCLAMPPRQPDYRENRGHASFVTNLEVEPQALRTRLIDAWGAHESREDWPRERVADLVAARYGLAEWNLGR
jgi:lipoate---protein ligase